MKDGKYEGSTGWDPAPITIKNAILREDNKELATDIEVNGCKYTATLKQTINGKYEGTFIRQQGGEKHTGNCSCRLFEDGEDILLFGRWQEDGCSYTWWAKLETLE